MKENIYDLIKEITELNHFNNLAIMFNDNYNAIEDYNTCKAISPKLQGVKVYKSSNSNFIPGLYDVNHKIELTFNRGGEDGEWMTFRMLGESIEETLIKTAEKFRDNKYQNEYMDKYL